MKTKSEYQKFENLAGKILSVPHSKIKRKLNAEKAAKKRKKLKVSSVSRETA
jgi:hypothetical protein